MIKKILLMLLMGITSVNSYANIHIKGDVATRILREYIPDVEVRSKVIEVYNEELNKNNPRNTISVESMTRICDAAGWDRKKDAVKRSMFRIALIGAANDQYRYYEVCGKDRDDNDPNKHCVDNVFTDIEVQFAQAKNLAKEYAFIKYKDEIFCSSDIDKRGKDDYIKCTSKINPVYYEFKFDDAKESNSSGGKYVQQEFARGLCLVYGGEPDENVSKLRSNIRDRIGKADFSARCKIPMECDILNDKLSKWAYMVSAGNDDKCVITYNTKDTSAGLSKDYYAKFDGKSFVVYHKDKPIKFWPAVSGRGKTSRDSKPTICQLPKYQRCKNIGPTPEGVYYVSQNEIQYLDNITIGGFTSDIPGNGLPIGRGGVVGWGESRVLLHPAESTNLYKRDPNMYIHGGQYNGSKGCIDLTTNISDFMEWFASQTEFLSLKVVVDYGYTEDFCTDCNETVCTPCKCITDVKDCEYI